MTVLDHVPPERLADLAALFRSAWWLTDRTPAETAVVLRESDLIIAVVEADRLVGFARVLTDYAHIALILDVVVSPDTRGAGHGATLLETIVSHLVSTAASQLARSVETAMDGGTPAYTSSSTNTSSAGKSVTKRWNTCSPTAGWSIATTT